MAFGCVDLQTRADLERFLEALERAVIDERAAYLPLPVSIGEREGRCRLWMHRDGANTYLGEVLARAAAATGVVERAIVGLDHDEFGAEHVVFDSHDGQLCRVQHVYVYPDGEPIEGYEEYGPAETLTALPVHADVEVGPDGIVDGPRSWTAVARLFGVPVERVASAAQQAANAHEHLGSVFTPFEPWWDALEVTPSDNVDVDVEIGGGRQLPTALAGLIDGKRLRIRRNR
jgi:hypothetical protein